MKIEAETRVFVWIQCGKSVMIPRFLGSLLLIQQNAQKAGEMLIDDSWSAGDHMPYGNSDWMYRRVNVLSSYPAF